jgi:hypothetical protein
MKEYKNKYAQDGFITTIIGIIIGLIALKYALRIDLMAILQSDQIKPYIVWIISHVHIMWDWIKTLI